MVEATVAHHNMDADEDAMVASNTSDEEEPQTAAGAQSGSNSSEDCDDNLDGDEDDDANSRDGDSDDGKEDDDASEVDLNEDPSTDSCAILVSACATGGGVGGHEAAPADGKRKDRLKERADGDPSVRNLILSAIGVMKNRKARPDTKRICNWIHRRFSIPYAVISQELEALVTKGELCRVDYKGSSSFRIISAGGKIARRKRKVEKTSPRPSSKSVPPQGLSLQALGMGGGISLRSLVEEFLGSAVSDQTVVSTKCISKAVETTQRVICKTTLLANLDLMLDKEVEAGLFQRAAPDQFLLTQLQPVQISYEPHPVQISWDMTGGAPHAGKTDEERKNDLIQEKLFKLKSSKEGKFKSPSRRVLALAFPSLKKPEVKCEPAEPEAPNGLGKGRAKRFKSAVANAAEKQQLSGFPAKKRKREEWRMMADQELLKRRQHHAQMNAHVDATGSAAARPGSMRQKKSRKIFDPADHEQPARKRKATSSPPPPAMLSSSFSSGSNMGAWATVSVASSGQSQSWSEEQPEPALPVTCAYCGQAEGGGKRGRAESLLFCSDCGSCGHPSCMEYSEELAGKINVATWQCINCKTCAICKDSNDDVVMLFCDSCDLGYHITCHIPPLMEKPRENQTWECFSCNPNQPLATKHRVTAKSGSNGEAAATNGHHDSPEDAFLPLLPPQLRPNTGLVPNNWEDYPIDSNIPDVSEWKAEQVKQYFNQHGFDDAQTAIFVAEEIDGKSLLLLHRQDVINSLGLKLGPALKVFGHVKRFQTRRNFPLF